MRSGVGVASRNESRRVCRSNLVGERTSKTQIAARIKETNPILITKAFVLCAPVQRVVVVEENIWRAEEIARFPNLTRRGETWHHNSYWATHFDPLK